MWHAPAEQIWQSVSPWLPGFTVEWLPEIDSTNSELMRRARGGGHDPVLLVAERQSAGRGRMGRVWEGAAGEALTFSLGLPLAPRDWSGLSLVVGLALAQALHPQVRIKWPNDLWWQQRKLAGILVEACTQGGRSYAVLGVGINIAVPAATGLRTPAAGLCEILPDLDAGQALARVVAPLVQAVLGFQRQGFAPWRSAYQARDGLANLAVTLSDGRSGTACGVDESGALLVHTAQGLQAVASAEISVRAQPSAAA